MKIKLIFVLKLSRVLTQWCRNSAVIIIRVHKVTIGDGRVHSVHVVHKVMVVTVGGREDLLAQRLGGLEPEKVVGGLAVVALECSRVEVTVRVRV